jgi:hypothetical protein
VSFERAGFGILPKRTLPPPKELPELPENDQSGFDFLCQAFVSILSSDLYSPESRVRRSLLRAPRRPERNSVVMTLSVFRKQKFEISKSEIIHPTSCSKTRTPSSALTNPPVSDFTVNVVFTL